MASLTHGREFEHTPGDAEGLASLVGHDRETEQQADWTNVCSIYPGLREKTQVGGIFGNVFLSSLCIICLQHHIGVLTFLVVPEKNL